MGRFSIHLRLLALSLLAVVTAAAMTAWLGYRQAVYEVDEIIDAQLAQYVSIIHVLANRSEHAQVAPPEVAGHAYQSKLLFQVWERDRSGAVLLMRSTDTPPNWPEGVSGAGYSNAVIGDRAWRAYAGGDPEYGHRIWAAMDLEIRDELAAEVAQSNLQPYLFGVPFMVALLFFAIGGGLKPLRRMEVELANRSPERLDPLDESATDGELRPLVASMNRLFERVARALENERRFTSDAAHELRTPLAALRAQLQVAQRTPSPEERDGAIAKALKGTDRMTHLVTQLLSLARLEGQTHAMPEVPVDLSELLRDVAAELVLVAEAKQLSLEVTSNDDFTLVGDPDLLRAMVRNLLDNAIRYTPAPGRIRAGVRAQEGGIVFWAADDGPGVTEQERQRLGLRFHRFGAQAAEGVGLGLSIVQRIAELHAATVSFSTGLDGRGLRVQVAFPVNPAGNGTDRSAPSAPVLPAPARERSTPSGPVPGRFEP